MGPDVNSVSATLVLLVRHGLTPTTGQVLPGRAPGLHLSEAGRAQAETAAERIAGLPVTAVYTSPLERTRETAAPIARRFGLEAQVDAGLLECEFGEWTGRKISELATLPEWRTVQKKPSEFRFPGGESFEEMSDRVLAALFAQARRHCGEVIVCVSHADPLKAAIAHLDGRDLDGFQSVVVDPASISVAEFTTAGDTRMRSCNTTSGEVGIRR